MTLPDYKRRQIEHEDRYRPRYSLEPIHRTPVEEFYAEREYSVGLTLLQKLLPLQEVKTALVCGVGAGDDLHYWLTHMPVAHVIGLDFSIEAIRSTQRRIQLNHLPEIVHFALADFENNPLQDDAIDLGIFVRTLHHALDPELGFKELWRVSRRGVLLIEPLATPVTRLFARLGIARDVEEEGNKVIRFTLRQYLSWAGRECSAYRSRTYLYYYHPLIYNRLLPLFNSHRGAKLFDKLYWMGNALLIPFRSKMAAVLVK